MPRPSAATALALALACTQTGANTPAASYVDRVLDERPLSVPGAERAADAEASATELPRTFRLSYGLHRSREQDPLGQQALLAAQLDTVNFGALSLEAQLIQGPQSAQLSLRQRQFPLSGTWWAHHELGVVAGAPLPVVRRAARVGLPTPVLWGASGEWWSPALGLHIQASAGTPGQFEGAPFARWRRLEGLRSSFGVEWQGKPLASAFSGTWTAALQLDETRIGTTGLALSPGRSALAAVRHQGPELTLFAQQLFSKPPGQAQRLGTWLETEWRRNGWLVGASALRLDPDLRWAGTPIVSNVEALQARLQWSGGQQGFEASLEQLKSRNRNTPAGRYATLSGWQRLGPHAQCQAGLAFRDYREEAWSGQLDCRSRSTLGETAARLAMRDASVFEREWRATLEQQWAGLELYGLKLATSATGGLWIDRGRSERLPLFGAALNLQFSPTGGMLLRAVADYERRGERERRAALQAFAEWRFAPGWVLELQGSLTRGRLDPRPSIDPLAPVATVPVPLAGSHVIAWLRWSEQRGRAPQVLGNPAVPGAGSIEGEVFFDENDNGRRDAGERGAGNVLIVLDGRYFTRSDADGRFEFPLVRPGRWRVSVREDTLPLPWQSGIGEGLTIELARRDSVRLTIPLKRLP
ncbi:MAG: carboxypeptidase-like regulatory domain-containing protein [Casimicrobiaceae bacterium]|nr:carboxypeptidase-like regulatory domain-containing protein [Casimicrobiaceae bacterium]MDW8312702.1 carboxypeptidase-like regulatory domain-containing protein [Burkholderiales bacterium]